jgi:hypothetical protein
VPGEGPARAAIVGRAACDGAAGRRSAGGRDRGRGNAIAGACRRVGRQGWFIYQIVQWRYPITFETSAWYAGYGYAALFVVGGIAFYGFRTSLGGRRLVEIADT